MPWLERTKATDNKKSRANTVRKLAQSGTHGEEVPASEDTKQFNRWLSHNQVVETTTGK